MVLTGEKLVPVPLFPQYIFRALQRSPGQHTCYTLKVYFQLQTQFLLHRKHAASLTRTSSP
jgi:hypothetical protein